MANTFKDCHDKTLSVLKSSLPLTETDAKEYKKVKLSALIKFDIEKFDIRDFGNLCIMRYDIGLMKMLTVVLTPMKKDLPFLSLDFMIIGGTRKFYAEFYDLTEIIDDTYRSWINKYNEIIKKYSSLTDFSAKGAWYDNILTAKGYKTFKKNDDAIFINLYEELLREYTAQINAYPVLDEASAIAKTKKIKEYSDRLIDEGGISTDMFKKKLGAEKTRDFFDKVFFGTRK
ncbi:MAG: hypothetical protein IJT81_00705 [Lachnospiraceae bacterium]|nr:hypothetical protein [Lachnospiraceae bacterium]